VCQVGEKIVEEKEVVLRANVGHSIVTNGDFVAHSMPRGVATRLVPNYFEDFLFLVSLLAFISRFVQFHPASSALQVDAGCSNACLYHAVRSIGL